MIARHRALALLDECTGETIWPIELCHDRLVPRPWIDELCDAFESNPGVDRDTIYFQESPTNQFHGVRDVDLAIKLGSVLGIHTQSIIDRSLTRAAVVAAIKEEVFEM